LNGLPDLRSGIWVPEKAEGGGMNSFGILQALAFEPKKAFAELDTRPLILFPMVVLVLPGG
jgi:hypothetical protein